MAEDGVVPLRRNASKQAISRGISRYGKTKGSSTTLHKHKHSQGPRRPLRAPGSQESLAEASPPPSSSGPPMSPRLSKPSRSKVNIPITLGGSSSSMGHRFRGLASYSHRKGVIQLDRDDEDDSNSEHFEDLSDDNEDGQGSMNDLDESHYLRVGIQPMEPTPPKLSEETVISVSSFADMATALKGARDKTGFVGNDDLFSTAVNRSKNFGEMARMVQGWNTGKRGPSFSMHHGLGTYGISASHRHSIPGEDDPREFEKVFREYTNTRAISNPVMNSLHRLFRADEANSGNQQPQLAASSSNSDKSRLYLPAGKKISPLVATTTDEMSDFSERRSVDRYSNFQNNGVIESISTYTLNKMWQNGLAETEMRERVDTDDDTSSTNEGIHDRALRVQQQITTKTGANS